jgi:hypothetical protein
MRAIEGGDELVAIAALRRTVAIPALGRQCGHHIDLVAPRGHVIRKHVAIRRPPFGAVADRLALDPTSRKHRARRRAADEARLVGAQHDLARPGANAVGADCDIGLGGRAIVERQRHAVCGLLDPHELVPVTDRAGPERLLQQLVQVGAVDIDERPAEARFASLVERQSVKCFTAVPGAADEGIGPNAGGGESLLQLETAQHLGDIGAENDAGANARETRRLLVHRDGKARALQQPGDREAGEAGAQDGDPHSAIHPNTSSNRIHRRRGTLSAI